jgi:hypothetical protein
MRGQHLRRALGSDAAPRPTGGDFQRSFRLVAAVLPFLAGSISNSTVWPSRSSGSPALRTAEISTKTS